MSIFNIWNTINNIGGAALGNRNRRQIIISCENEKVTLPVTPIEYETKSGQNNPVVDIIEDGEKVLFGNQKLRELNFSSFFPATHHEYPFIVGDNKDPADFIELFTKWKEGKKPVRVIITDSPINISMTISSFDYREQDGTRDIYYDLSLVEYRPFNVPQANNSSGIDEATGLRERNSEPSIAKKNAGIERARDLLEASRKAYNDFNHYRMLANSAGIQGLAIRNMRAMAQGGKLKI